MSEQPPIAERDAQQVEHEEHVAAAEARGECPFSGLTFARCQASICDCFRDQYPDDPYGLHPEAFVVGARDTSPGTGGCVCPPGSPLHFDRCPLPPAGGRASEAPDA